MELSADSGARLGLSWEAPGTCPDFRFSTWEPSRWQAGWEEVSCCCTNIRWHQAGWRAASLPIKALGTENSPTRGARFAAPGLATSRVSSVVSGQAWDPPPGLSISEVRRWHVPGLQCSEPRPGSQRFPVRAMPRFPHWNLQPQVVMTGLGSGNWFSIHTSHCGPCPRSPDLPHCGLCLCRPAHPSSRAHGGGKLQAGCVLWSRG